MEVTINKLAKKARVKMPDLLTRPVGRRMYKKLLEMLTIVESEEVVVLDFEGIKVIDSSFIDEFIVKILSEERGFYVKLRNISSIAERNIASVFKSYDDYNKKIVVMTEDICLNNNFYIGALQSVEEDIFNYVRVNKSATVKELMHISGLEEEQVLETVNKLKTLHIIREQSRGVFITL